MLQCFYLPLYVILLAKECAQLYSPAVATLLGILLLVPPFLFLFVILGPILRRYTMLHCVTEPDSEVVASTIEMMEFAHEHLEGLRRKIFERVEREEGRECTEVLLAARFLFRTINGRC